MYPLFQSAGQLQYGWTPGCEPQAPVWECGVLCAAVQLLPANPTYRHLHTRNGSSGRQEKSWNVAQIAMFKLYHMMCLPAIL